MFLLKRFLSQSVSFQYTYFIDRPIPNEIVRTKTLTTRTTLFGLNVIVLVFAPNASSASALRYFYATQVLVNCFCSID